MIKTSVIIPVYDTAEYLEECIESVLAQTQKEIEIFLVDDGSTDGSLEIIDRYVQRYPFIYKITQQHEYQGTARNRGLKQARGRYVYFMDSDDAILPELFDTCYELCERMSLDYAIFDAYGFRYDENDVELKVPDDIFDRRILGIEDRVYSGPEFWNDFYNSHGILYLCWLHYIRRDFLLKNELFYEERTYFEDNDWTLRMYLNAQRLYYIPRQLHRHRWRRNSNMLGGFTCELMKGCFRMHWVLLKILRGCTEPEKLRMVRDVIRLNICRFDRLSEAEVPASYEPPLRDFFLDLCDAFSRCSIEDADIFVHMSAAERILNGIRNWDTDQEEYLAALRGAFRKAFPCLWDSSSIAIYGTGAVSRIMMELLERFAPERRCRLFFIHTTAQTGTVFEGHKVFNVLDAGSQHPDLILVGSAEYRESIDAQVKAHMDLSVPVLHVPWEVRFLQDDRRDLSRQQIKKHEVGKPSGAWESRRAFAAAGECYVMGLIRSAFPGMLSGASKAEDLTSGEVFAVEGDEEGRYSGETRKHLISQGVDERRIKNISGLMAEYLSLWEPVEFRPSMVMIDASTRCQLNCPGCYMRQNHYGTAGRGDLDPEKYKKFLEDNPSIKKVELSKSGEVFLNPRLSEILKISHEKGVEVQLLNGVNMNYAPDPVLEELVRTQVRAVKVSLDGATQEVYSLYRRGGDISRVLSNIRKINEYKKKYGSEYPKLVWQFILMDEDQHEAEAAKKMAAELGMDIYYTLDFRGFKPKDREWLQSVTGISFQDAKGTGKTKALEYMSDYFCRQMILTPQINWDGRLLGCCTVFQRDWGINVFEEPLSEVFNDPDYRAAAISILTGKDGMDHLGPCRECLIYRKNVIRNGCGLMI